MKNWLKEWLGIDLIEDKIAYLREQMPKLDSRIEKMEHPHHPAWMTEDMLTKPYITPDLPVRKKKPKKNKKPRKHT